MRIIAVIPARFASVRFPGKPLALLHGKSIISHVYERVVMSNLFFDVIVATDDTRIVDEVKRFDGRYQMTSSHHLSGSDRIAEVIANLDCDVVFNIQGDEPMIEAKPLSKVVSVFQDASVQVASLMTRIVNKEDLVNPNIVKVITDIYSNALYFSRSTIPFDRDGLQSIDYFRHIGVYAYRKQTLLKFIHFPPGRLELIEKLEQLRLLENGIPIRMVETDYQGIGIDTPDDLRKVESNLLI